MITFAIPFYSKPEFLRAAIQSVFDQTCRDWQILVVDDCGPDSAQARGVIDAFGAVDRIQYFKNERNLGLGGNWNRCLERVRTPYVTLLHSDDELLPNYASEMLEGFKRWPRAAALFCRTKIIDGEGREVFSMPDFVKRFLTRSSSEEFALEGESGLAALMRGNFIMCPTLCYSREALGASRFIPELRYVLDLEMTTRILLEGKTLVGLPAVAYAYRRHEVNTSALGTADMTMFREEVELYDRLAGIARSRGWESAARTAAAKRIIQLKVGYYALKDVLNLKGGAGVSKFRYLKSIRGGVTS